MGWTDEITVAVWVGYPDELRPMETEFRGQPVAGGTYPANIWRTFVERAITYKEYGKKDEDDEDPTLPGTTAPTTPGVTEESAPSTPAVPETTAPVRRRRHGPGARPDRPGRRAGRPGAGTRRAGARGRAARRAARHGRWRRRDRAARLSLDPG